MVVLAAHRAEKHFGERTLFSGVSFDVGEQDRIGLVGANGCGKTTLFRLITGRCALIPGDHSPRETRIGYMEQHVCATPTVLSGTRWKASLPRSRRRNGSWRRSTSCWRASGPGMPD